MVSIDSYSDLTTEIEIIILRLDSLQNERKHLVKLMWSSKPKNISAMGFDERVISGRNDMTLDRISENINRIDSMIFIEENILEGLQTSEKLISEKLKKFKGLEFKVAYMKIIEKKSLEDIATELNYNYNYIKNISAKIKTM